MPHALRPRRSRSTPAVATLLSLLAGGGCIGHNAATGGPAPTPDARAAGGTDSMPDGAIGAPDGTRPGGDSGGAGGDRPPSDARPGKPDAGEPTDAALPATDATRPADGGATADGRAPGLDTDDDGVPDDADNCPATANHDQSDADQDGLGDRCDPCPDLADPSGDPAACAPECEPGVTERRPCAVGDPESRTCVAGHYTAWSGCAEGCVAGATETRPCVGPAGGEQLRTCVDGNFTPWSDCPAECVDGVEQSRPCADAPALSQARVCVGGAWAEWSVCNPECLPGALEERPCADAPALTQSRDCAGGLWGDWSLCNPECVPGIEQSRPCPDAPALSQTRVCGGGLWSDWSVCNPECVPGAVEERPCADAPAIWQQRVCEGGLWGAYSACVPECVPGSLESRVCQVGGRAGHQSRACEGGLWGMYSACTADPECVAGQTQERACGINGAGLEVRSCQGGVYGPWSCTDPDVCVNGTQRTQACVGVMADQVSLCAGGQWGPFSACPPAGPCDTPDGEIVPGPIGAAPVSIQVDTRASIDHIAASCVATTGRDRIYTLHIATAGLYRIWVLAASFDTVMSLRTDCRDPASEVACNDDGARNANSELLVYLDPGDHTLLVDGFNGATGTAFVNVTHEPDPEFCGPDNDNDFAHATLETTPTFIMARALCPLIDRRDAYRIDLPTPGMVFGHVTRNGADPGGTVLAGFYAAGGGGLGAGAMGSAQIDIQAWAPVAGPTYFQVSDFNLSGLYSYNLALDYSPSIACVDDNRVGCISCDDVYEPNQTSATPRAVQTNVDLGLVATCQPDFDFYRVPLVAARDFRVVITIQAMLGSLAVLMLDGVNELNLVSSTNGLTYTYTGRAPRDGNYILNIHNVVGQASYRLRIDN